MTDHSDRASATPTPTGLFKQGFSTVFISTFITIFLAEIGDKTQLATLLISAESQAPFVVFIGAALALMTTSLMGVLLGQWLAKMVSQRQLQVMVASLLLVIAILLLGDVVEGV
ncbi:TMEM165/GDT1 family protein [Euhalothece natronophila Z-M001]|uniref:GDT1 family protein n=1 Tax=Euhalothece natronophila Z-M001 TaxID=522448 RepID=A0A5B8NRN3_9CHRO|nr:TMEM165/GDT1 family protein [Euhalothece natronophila]QDZ40895.1 TMEM165/GDT1 family protein [Euhalothece natronophila Z-M001]